jgi:hypothetical protein
LIGLTLRHCPCTLYDRLQFHAGYDFLALTRACGV